MDQIFKEISEKEQGQLLIDNQTVSVGLGARSPYKVYSIKVEYRDLDIIVTNEVGTTAIGRIVCQLPKEVKLTSFEINVKCHFLSLFYGKNNRVEINGDNKRFNSFLKKELKKSELHLMIKKTKLEPYIFTKQNQLGFKIITEYHLLYHEWPTAISPLIAYYKVIIDAFLDKNI